MDNLGKNVVACGCFHRRDKYKIITDHTVRIPCQASVNAKEYTIVEHFCSLQFDGLLFKEGSQRMFDDNDIEVEDPIVNHVLRKHVKKLVDLVNDKHGWTMVGWVQTGKVKDASETGNKEAIDIAAEDVSPHVTYLFPSDPEDVNPNKVAEYKKLLIMEAVF